MKLLTALSIIILGSCTAITKPIVKTEKRLTLTVKAINRTDNGNEIWAKGRPYLYYANCPTIPDSLKVGTSIVAEPKPDTCSCPCVFRKWYRGLRK